MFGRRYVWGGRWGRIENLALAKERLSKQQKEAVYAPIKPCLVVAGPRSQKEKIFKYRTLFWIRDNNISPEKIIILTYNKVVADNISLSFSGEKSLEKIKIFDFLSFCENFLKNEGIDFRTCNESDTINLIGRIIENLQLSIPSYKECSNLILDLKKIEKFRKNGPSYEDFLKILKKYSNISDEKIEKIYSFENIKKIWNEYSKTLRSQNLFDYLDLLSEVNKLLDNELILKKWKEQLKGIIFDGFQDIDPIQFRIIIKLARENQNIFCVGDPDFAIYVFTGKMHNSYEKFLDFFPYAEIFKIEEDCFSTPAILRALNKLINIGKNQVFLKKNLVSRPQGKKEKINLKVFEDQEQEAKWVFEKIYRLKEEGRANFKNCAVFFRNWNLGRIIKKTLFEKNIPTFSEELSKILKQEETKDILAYLNIAFEKDQQVINKEISRVLNKPARKIGRQKFENLKEKAEICNFSLIEAISRDKEDPNLRNFTKVIEEIQNIARDNTKSLRKRFKEILEKSEILNYFSAFDNKVIEDFEFLLDSVFEKDLYNFEDFKNRLDELREYDLSKNVVYLSTIHTGKNKFFENVFLISLNEGVLPCSKALIGKDGIKLKKAIEEERRVTFVGGFSAKLRLFISCSNGEKNISRFIRDIKSECFIERNL